MKKIVVYAFVFFFSIPFLQAQKTLHACNPDKSVCAKIDFAKKISSQEDAAFKIKFVLTQNQNLQLTEVSLWMPMPEYGPDEGHPSAPVKWVATPGEKNAYDVSEADFYMPGDWQIKVNYTVDGKSELLIFFVQV